MSDTQSVAALFDERIKAAFERGRTQGIFDVVGTVRADEAMYTGIIEQARVEHEPHDYTLGKRNALRDIIKEWGR